MKNIKFEKKIKNIDASMSFYEQKQKTLITFFFINDLFAPITFSHALFEGLLVHEVLKIQH